MKNIFLIVSILFLFIHCKKEEIPEPQPSETNVYFPGNMQYGQANATKIDKAWQASAVAYVEDNPNLLILKITTVSKNDFLRETLTFFFLPKTTGSYPLKASYSEGNLSATYGLSKDDGDVPGTYYNFEEAVNDNILEVTSIDTIAKTLTGKFTVSFTKIENFAAAPNDPEEVKFSNGTFEAQIVE